MPIPESTDPAAFKAFEHERWQTAARVYHDELGRLTSQAANPLLDAAGVSAGVRHLDLASGPGYVAGLSAARGAQVTGADFSEEMVELARSLHPGVEFYEADAEALTFEDASFDAVTMAFLLGHLARPAAAVREAHRVLRPGGRLALAWWQPPDRAVAFGIMTESIRAKGRTDVGLPPAPPLEMFGDPEMLRALLNENGFAETHIRDIDMTWRVDSVDAMFDAYLRGTARMGGLLLGQTPEALAAIREEVRRRCEPWKSADGLHLPMPARIASSTRS